MNLKNKNALLSYYVFFFSTIFSLTTGGLSAETKTMKCATEWVNLHKGNSNLIGVYVQEVPDNIDDAKLYRGKHPLAITYLFSNKKTHTVSYTPIGQVKDSRWIDVKENNWIYSLVRDGYKNRNVCKYWYTNAELNSK